LPVEPAFVCDVKKELELFIYELAAELVDDIVNKLPCAVVFP
jgi:hypothetical protein